MVICSAINFIGFQASKAHLLISSRAKQLLLVTFCDTTARIGAT